MSPKTGADLFIVDNSDSDWKVLNYLREWTDISSQFDICTGYFEIGSLLALDGDWEIDQVVEAHGGFPLTDRAKSEVPMV